MFNWFSFLSYAIITAVTPGPNTIMSMTNGNRYGFRKALPFNMGIWVGFTLVMVLCTVFCNALGDLIPQIKMPMLFIGGAYMLHLAWDTFRSSGEINEREDARSSFISGFMLQFVNPKIYIYCIMSMEAYILPFYQGEYAPLMAFALLLAFIGFAFTLVWSAFGSVFRKLFSQHARIVNTIMAALLVYCAVSLFMA